MKSACFDSALKLHRYLVGNHWRNQALIGPDPGVRLNYRVGRFIKNYLRKISFRDDYYYLQAQGYWILSNWRLFAATGDESYRDLALACSRAMLARQRHDGAWLYPNREWQGRIATAEGTWGSLGLLESYRSTAIAEFLAGALRWHKYLHDTIGFQRVGDKWAVNYFAQPGSLRVPNNSAFVLRFLAQLADATGDRVYQEPCPNLLNFIEWVQMPTGEFPYAVEDRPHFQCYQYNAFQSLDLMAYHEITGDPVSLSLAIRALDFLREGLDDDGHARYECGNFYRRVTYHTAALGAAFCKARLLGADGYELLAARAYEYLLRFQWPDGGFSYSRGDYRLLRDQRSYPRYLAMILLHLLANADVPAQACLNQGARTDTNHSSLS